MAFFDCQSGGTASGIITITVNDYIKEANQSASVNANHTIVIDLDNKTAIVSSGIPYSNSWNLSGSYYTHTHSITNVTFTN